MNKKYYGFNLVEILLTMTLIGVMAVGFLPVLTKRANKSANPDCLNGYKMVQKIYYEDGTFSVPDNIASDIKFTLVGGGQGGTGGRYYSQNNLIVIYRPDNCALSRLPVSGSNFYTNVKFDIVAQGKSADCSNVTPIAGTAGRHQIDIIVKNTEKGDGNVFSCVIPDSSATSITCTGIKASFVSNSNRIEGQKYNPTSNSFLFDKLEGGIPPTFIRLQNGKYAGAGEGCVLSDPDNAIYVADSTNPATDGACRIKYNIATPGSGGNGGKYLETSERVAPETILTINIGKGGAGGGVGITGSNGQDTRILAGGQVLFSTQSVELSENSLGNSPAGNSSLIEGGSGGNILLANGRIYSQGAFGGCSGVSSSYFCSSPDGKNGTRGSGGGGGSCSDDRCGIGGRGGDGVVIIEYKEQCDR